MYSKRPLNQHWQYSGVNSKQLKIINFSIPDTERFILCPAHPQFGIPFPPSYLNNVCHVFSLQLYKVSKNLHTLGSSIRIMYNYRMTFTTFRNWFCSVSLLHIVFPDFYNSAKNQWSKWSFLFNILYLICPLERPKVRSSLYCQVSWIYSYWWKMRS